MTGASFLSARNEIGVGEAEALDLGHQRSRSAGVAAGPATTLQYGLPLLVSLRTVAGEPALVTDVGGALGIRLDTEDAELDQGLAALGGVAGFASAGAGVDASGAVVTAAGATAVAPAAVCGFQRRGIGDGSLGLRLGFALPPLLLRCGFGCGRCLGITGSRSGTGGLRPAVSLCRDRPCRWRRRPRWCRALRVPRSRKPRFRKHRGSACSASGAAAGGSSRRSAVTFTSAGWPASSPARLRHLTRSGSAGPGSRVRA